MRSVQYDQVLFPRMVFQVPPGTAAVYVGTLRMDATGTQVLARFFARRVGVAVVDEFQTAKDELARRHPALAAALVSRPMADNPAIPHDPAEADRNAWLQILNAIGFGLLVVR